MSGFPPTDKTLVGVLKDARERIDLLERRLAGGSSGGGDSSVPYDAQPGFIAPFGGGAVPSGWLLCDGSAQPRGAYPELFGAIGITWGAGNGTTTFNVPDLRGRTLVGRDPAQTEFDVLGETGGAKTHTLTVAQMPSHQHNLDQDGGNLGLAEAGGPQRFTTSFGFTRADADMVSGATGGGGAHNNLQPYGVTNYIISTGSGVGGGGSSVPALPDPWAGAYNGTISVTEAAGIWGNMLASGELTYAVTLPYPMWVDVELSGYMVGAIGAYGMFGVAASGALTLAPEHDQATGGTAWFGYTAFSETSPGRTTSVHKHLLLPAGTTTLRMQKRRSGTASTPSIGYPTMIVTPRSWVGAPGANQNMTRGTTSQRDAVYGVPATDADRVALANQQVQWINTTKGYTETYYATTGIAGLTARGLLAGHASGWYPVGGSALIARRVKIDGYQSIVAGGNVDPIMASPLAMDLGGFTATDASGIVMPFGGHYRVHGQVYFTGGGTNTMVYCRIFVAGGLVLSTADHRPTNLDLISKTTAIISATAGTKVALVAQTSVACSIYGPATSYYQTFLEVEYLGPPLVNG